MRIITGSTTFTHVSEPLSLTLLMIHTGPRDYNRVQLKGDPDVEGSDYINASMNDVSVILQNALLPCYFHRAILTRREVT